MAQYILVSCVGKRPHLRGPYDHFTAERKLEDVEEKSLETGEKITAEIVEFPTRSLEMATRMLKEQRIDESGYTEGTRNIRHKGVL